MADKELTEAQRLAYLNSKTKRKKPSPPAVPDPPVAVVEPVSLADVGATVEPVEEKLPTPPPSPPSTPPPPKKRSAKPKEEPFALPAEAVDLIAQRVADVFATKYAVPPPPEKPKPARRPRKPKTPEPPELPPTPPRRHSFLWF